MNKKRFVFAVMAAALALGACTRTQELDGFDQQEPEAQEAVGFDIYTRNAVQTKAGYVGDIDETSFKVTGFGVYAYVSREGKKWESGKATWEPDFMRNQHVTFSGGNWVYSPVKYWPNQANTNGNAVDNAGATNAGAKVDYVSFFAYAPYVQEAPYAEKDAALTNAGAKEGILYIPGVDAQGDPEIVYQVASDPSNSVDLMYGVAAHDYTTAMTVGNYGSEVTAGYPFKDMTKLTTGAKMDYRFRHALAKLSVNVDGYFDEVNTGTPGTNDVDPNTRIVIENVQIKTNMLATLGTLNLNNAAANTPKWTTPGDIGAGLDLPIATALKHVSGSEGSVVYFSQQPLGVTRTKQSLMGYGADGITPASLMLIPTSNVSPSSLEVTITYKVITRDARLESGYHVATNVIKNTIDGASLPFTAGTATTLNLHLGMTTVKFDATVSNWEDAAETGTDVPLNVPYMSFASPLSMSIWKSGGAQANAVTIMSGSDNLTDQYNFAWSSSATGIVTVGTGTSASEAITPVSVGEATITVTATKKTGDPLSQTASFKVYVNAISAVTLTASKEQVAVGESSDLTATLTFVYGPMESLPFTLLALDAGGDTYLTLGAQSLSSNVVTAKATGKAYGGDPRTITATVPEAYTSGGATLNATAKVNCAPVGTTGHVFTVGPGANDKVYFAHSNLQYKSGTWSLMEHPWSTVKANGSVDSDYGYPTPGTAAISLFGWGTSGAKAGSPWGDYKEPWNTDTVNEKYGPTTGNIAPANDWGANIGDGWRVPTGGPGGEWYYLLNTRTPVSGVRYARAQVNGVNGLIILPDDWKTSYHALASTNTPDAAYTTNKITASDWNTELAPNGAVFLPAAGRRDGTDIHGHVGGVGYDGHYWSSTASGDYVYQLLFYDSELVADELYRGGTRSAGLSVRLVRVLE